MQRRHDLDWLRVIAFGLLVLYHVGMYYVTWDWHVKSPTTHLMLEPVMLLSSPWRISLLLLISGVATAFMLRSRPGACYIDDRASCCCRCCSAWP
ncbi:surface polysaccharide O-acyltransferase-like enzyme [Xanthomonas arboricola]|uniref:acyltransferase family protein n=1 Tax=Xanthomonas campestris TaxID=339 RepID=UPI0023EA3317|nr:surface polysaccharide O-acyltransferase-like enzyme [Xanthomonas campestris]MCW2006272.1 surface polysaccharide O-acyltransferase-like enzyme [Xanthomonas campestris]